MKKFLSLFLVFIMMATVVFAAYPEDREAEESLADEGLMVFNPEDIDEIQDDEIDEDYVDGDDLEDIMLIEDYDEENIIQEDVYKVEEEVTINESINGNVYVITKDLKIESAYILGNLYAIAENIEIVDSEVDGASYIIGENIVFSGATSDLYALGSKVELTEDSYIWRDARIAADELKFNGIINRSVFVTTNNLVVGDSAEVYGTLNYWSENEAEISGNAQIEEIKFNKTEISEQDNADIIQDYIMSCIGFVFKTLVVVLAVVFFASKFNKMERTDKVANDFLKYCGKGAGMLLVIPIIVILLIVSNVGIGLGFSLFAIYAVLLYVAVAFACLEIAYRISNKTEVSKGKLIGISVAISAIVWVISLIPTIGGLVNFILILIGLGIIFDLMFKKEKVDEN